MTWKRTVLMAGAKVLLCQPRLPLHLHYAAHRLRPPRLLLAVQTQSETIAITVVQFCFDRTRSFFYFVPQVWNGQAGSTTILMRWDDYCISDICCDELNNSTNCLMDWTKPIVKDHCRYNESVTDFSLMQVIAHNVELDFDFRWKILIWSAFDDKKIWFDNLDCIAG